MSSFNVNSKQSFMPYVRLVQQTKTLMVVYDEQQQSTIVNCRTLWAAAAADVQDFHRRCTTMEVYQLLLDYILHFVGRT